MNNHVLSSAIFEHRFWLQVLGDHSRFIRDGLAPKEKTAIEQANEFIHMFDTLLNRARSTLSASETAELTIQAKQAALRLRRFKLQLLERHLVGKIDIHLPPTFLNHMVNELEEYVLVLKCLEQNQVPVFDPVHHHLLWLSDAAGHAASITSNLDMVEKDMIKRSNKFEKKFENFYLKAIELAKYMRTNLKQFPALGRFNTDVELEITLFRHFLNELEELRINDELLGTLSPLMADHMAREECYYLIKLAQVAGTKNPGCDPTHPRVEA
ncbi:DUF2935 domain-containing protein [Paenibacillus sp. MSJ-34]|uniref:DUF2935 domain-containing protein n=1 Tax=Paenibacillus sp. MSJ-34 TaxID=2841529 RepID=UPI001C0FC18A|nr:DUF2935 domain-containing protein [Paenibacillus sp. MSJ-34]MBU5445526.1 DUF2935 domain-containing protein [Paenibacillus sp. MSJ-34]